MAIDLQSLSITSAFNSIVDYFRSQENNTSWKPLSNSSEGSFLIRLLANVMSVISYRIVAQSRENYLSTAVLPASNIGIAVNLGYSVPRGSNLKRLIRLIPNGNYTIPKLSVIGSYNTEYSILNLEPIALEEGVPINIETVVGNLREESFITGTSDIKIFTLFNSNISDDFVLFKDNLEVPTTDVLKEMLDNKYLVRTNPYSSVDIAFLNTLETADENLKYGTGTEITIRYVELADVPVIPYADSMFTYGTLDDYRTIQGNQGMETVDSIKVTAPLYHEVQNLIRSKADYASALRINVPSVTEVNFIARTPVLTQITYLKDKYNLLTGTYLPEGSSRDNEENLKATEIGTFRELLKDQNYFGTPLPDIVTPKREVAFLHIGIALKNKYKDIADIDFDVNNILDNFYNTYLNVEFNTYELERQIESLSYVKYARVSYKVFDREKNTMYQLGYVIQDPDTGEYYKAAATNGLTGVQKNGELDWASDITVGTEIDTQAVFLDGSIYWKAFKKLADMTPFKIQRRYPNRNYSIGDFVYVSDNEALKDFMFECIDVVRVSASTPPDTSMTEIGEFVEDDGIIWVAIDRVSDPTITSRQNSTRYRIGQRANPEGRDDITLECVSYASRTSSYDGIQFFKGYYPIIADSVTDTSFAIKGSYRDYFKVGDTITLEYTLRGGSSGNVSPTVVDVRVGTDTVSKEVRTTITVNRDIIPIGEIRTYTNVYPVARPTQDGEVAWEIMEDPTKVQYGWNSYVTFKHELEILEG